MRELVVIEYLTLDGVLQGPGHDGEDVDGGFTEGGWSRPFLPEHRRYSADLYRTAEAFLFGRRTYEIWIDYWPAVTDPDDHIAAALNSRPKYVLSSTLDKAAWNGTTVLRTRDELFATVDGLKDQNGGHILVPGSGGLVQTLAEAGLIDRYQLWLHPVAVGRGKRLFERHTELALVDATTTGTGLVILNYAV